MKKPIAISIGLFVFLFGLAFAKTMKAQADAGSTANRTPASTARATK